MNFFRSQDNFIQITKGAVSKRDCDNLIKIFEISSNNYDEEREYSASSMNILSPECISFRNALITSLKKYGEKYFFLRSNPHMQGINIEFNVQKYEPQKAYKGLHCEDWDPYETHVKRIMGWMFYLNTVKKNGGTEWPHLNFKSKPKAGDLYIWPAGWTHAHRGIVADKEVKYIATGWVRLVIDGENSFKLC